MKNHSKQSKDLTPLSLKVRTALYALRRRWLLSAPNEKTSICGVLSRVLPKSGPSTGIYYCDVNLPPKGQNSGAYLPLFCPFLPIFDVVYLFQCCECEKIAQNHVFSVKNSTPLPAFFKHYIFGMFIFKYS